VSGTALLVGGRRIQACAATAMVGILLPRETRIRGCQGAEVGLSRERLRTAVLRLAPVLPEEEVRGRHIS